MRTAAIILALALGGTFLLAVPQQHEAALKQALQLILDNKPGQAVALLDPLVAKSPHAADVHEMLGSAHAAAAEALEGEQNPSPRQRHLEAAATHFKRAVDLTHVNKAANLGSLVEIYSPDGLNRPQLEEMYAQRLVTEHPTLTTGYPALARLHAQADRLKAATEVLRSARTATPLDRQEQIATELVDQTRMLSPRATAAARLLLDEAMRIADTLISASPRDGNPLMLKSVVLETQANRLEPDPARRAAMRAESEKLRARATELQKRR